MSRHRWKMKKPPQGQPTAHGEWREDATPVEDPKKKEPGRSVPMSEDRVEEASMESFPCSDPPGYYSTHA